MKPEANATRDELIRYIEDELGWDVVGMGIDQDDRYEDEPIELELEMRCRKEIEPDNEYQIK